jgi:predicted phage tail component-like protein
MMGFRFNGGHSSSLKVYLEKEPKIPLTPTLKDYYEDIAGRSGSYLFAQPYGDKTITVSCLLLSETREERISLAKQIAKWLVTIKRTQIVFDEDETVYYVGKLEKQIDFDSLISYGKFELTFRCEPFSYSTQQNEINWVASNGEVLKVLSGGTAEVKPKITISANYGFLGGITLEVNGYDFIYNGQIQQNLEIFVDSKYFTVSTNPNSDSNVTGTGTSMGSSVLNDIDGAFPIMQGGENTFKFTSINGISADILIEWEDTFL